MSSRLTISAEFPAADRAAWEKIVEKALKGRAIESLDSRTEHGLPVKALYREPDAGDQRQDIGFPGSHPHVRGGSATRDAWLPWDIRQMVRHPDPDVAREEVFEALNNGVSSLELRFDADAENGIRLGQSSDLAKLIDGVKLDLAALSLDLVGAAVGKEAELAVMFAAAVPDADREDALIAFNIDPIAAFARTGRCDSSLADCIGSDVAISRSLVEAFPKSTVLRVDARVVHEAGGTEVQELAYLAASFATYMRAAIDAGAEPSRAVRGTLFTVAVGSDYHVEIPKLRAARRILGRVAEAFGAEGSIQLQAVTSRRMLAARDAWTNLLRNTAACFAAGVGGADIVTVRTFTDALGHAGPLARRMARNTQIIAQEESGLGRVIDPPGGSWAFDQMTEQLSQAAWAMFQGMERDGGIGHALEQGHFQADVAEARQARRRAVALRKEWVTGVNDFPDLEEVTPATVEVAHTGDREAAEAKAADLTERSYEAIHSAARAGIAFGQLIAAKNSEPETHCDPLWPIRLGEPFEALRDVADQRREAGKPPRIYLAALGPLAEHSARLTYATNFFAAGGIEATPAAGTAEELAEAFKGSDCELVCICGADARYEAEAEQAAKALRAAGAGRIYLAGKPGQMKQAYLDSGIDEFIFVGVDVVASLELAHAELGLGAAARS